MSQDDETKAIIEEALLEAAEEMGIGAEKDWSMASRKKRKKCANNGRANWGGSYYKQKGAAYYTQSDRFRNKKRTKQELSTIEV